MSTHDQWMAGFVVAATLAVTAAHAEEATWPQFRGARADGTAAAACPQVWDESSHVAWKVSLEGEGWSSPVVWQDRVFLTTAVPLAEASDDSGPEPYRGGGGRQRDDLPDVTYRWQVLCLDAASGQTRWSRTAHVGKPSIPRHSSNTYATETPITDGERVYAYFGMTGLFCFEMTGEPLWEIDLGSFEMRAGWGTSSSPVLSEGKLFVQVDNEQQSFLVAIDAATGEEIWRVQRDESSQYSSPIVWDNSHRSELIVGGQFYRSYDPATGELLWSLDMAKGRSSATALAVGDRLFVGTELRNRGGPDDGGGFLFAVVPGGKGDITPAEGADRGPFVRWKIDRSGLQMASPVHCAGHLYLLERRSGRLHCVNAETGETAYRERIPGARAFWASPWTCGDLVYCLDDAGTTHVIRGGPEFSVVRQNDVEAQTWSSPAIAGGALYLRTVDQLFCIGSAAD